MAHICYMAVSLASCMAHICYMAVSLASWITCRNGAVLPITRRGGAMPYSHSDAICGTQWCYMWHTVMLYVTYSDAMCNIQSKRGCNALFTQWCYMWHTVMLCVAHSDAMCNIQSKRRCNATEMPSCRESKIGAWHGRMHAHMHAYKLLMLPVQ